MHENILVSAERLNELIASGACVAFDCRFDFSDTDAGRKAWLAGHVPGARYAHLDSDLSSPILTYTGRHPLPDTRNFAKFLADAGWQRGQLLVAYDEGSNAIASRLWWLMRYHGQSAALLDGGLAAWKAAGYGLETGQGASRAVAATELEPLPGMTVSSVEVLADLDDLAIVDARASERFTGKVENLDTRAGHIPGALNRPFGANLQLNGRFRDRSALRAEFEALLTNSSLSDVVHSCGSGVTACHNLFAMELAGLAGTRLYAGSWSEWIRDPSRPVATGA